MHILTYRPWVSVGELAFGSITQLPETVGTFRKSQMGGGIVYGDSVVVVDPLDSGAIGTITVYVELGVCFLGFVILGRNQEVLLEELSAAGVVGNIDGDFFVSHGGDFNIGFRDGEAYNFTAYSRAYCAAALCT